MKPASEEHLTGWLARHQTPVRSLLILSAALFAAEYTVMSFLEMLPDIGRWYHYALDSSMMLLLAFPALFLFVLLPLHRQIDQRKRAEAELREHRESLEQTIGERTSELKNSNRQLQETIAELDESRRDLNRAQAVAHTGSWRLDLRNNRLLWSEETYRIFGVREGTRLTYDLFLNCVHPDDRAFVDREWKSALMGRPYNIEHRIVAGDKRKWVREKAELEFNRDGTLRGGFGTVQDISELKKAEAALAESERRYRDLVELSPDGIIVQRDHVCVFANSAALKLLGVANAQELMALGCDICGFIRAEDQPATSLWLDRIQVDAAGALPTHECQMLVPGHPAMYVEVRAKPIHFEGHPAVQIIFRDVTERRRVLAERERLLAQLANERTILNVTMENTRAQLAYLDADFNFLHVNSAYERGCGYSREELIGRNHFTLFPNAENEAIFRQVRDTGQPVEFFAKPFEFPNQPERGVTFWDWTLVCMRHPGGRVEGLVLSLMDVTATKRAAVALRETEERIREALQVGRMFTFEWDPSTDVVVRSSHSADILGLQENATRETGRQFFLRIHPEDRDRFTSLLAQLTPAADRYRTTYRVIRPDDSVVILEEAACGFFDSKGTLMRLTGVTADVTQREQAQGAELARMARAATVDHLAASLAHELRQPLTAIMSNAEAATNFLAQLPPDVGEVQEALKDIIGNTDRAREIIQRIRALHRKTDVEHTAVDLNKVINETVALLHSELILRQVSCRLELDPRLPAANGNRIELQQVIINLVLNAAEAMAEVAADERSLSIGTSRGDNGDVRVTVRDTGTGLAPAATTRLFEPFFTTKESGMGMGLNVCRSIIQAHGGRMWGVNNTDRGATFQFSVPIQP